MSVDNADCGSSVDNDTLSVDESNEIKSTSDSSNQVEKINESKIINSPGMRKRNDSTLVAMKSIIRTSPRKSNDCSSLLSENNKVVRHLDTPELMSITVDS